MKKSIKTNALRILEKAKIPYRIEEYGYDEEHLSGKYIIDQVSLPAHQIFKTLVLQDNHGEYLVCCIPVLKNLDLKKAAKVSHHKSVAMIHVKELLPVTGYVRGGCSPVGMKKIFPTYFDSSIEGLPEVAFSAGKRGYQMIVKPEDMISFINGIKADISEE